MQTSPLWKQILRGNFVDINSLADYLELDEAERAILLPRKRFALNLPRRLAEKIVKKSLEDPILKQFVPTVAENQHTEGFRSDPVGDTACRRAKKLLCKYQGRVLLTCTSACAMHCRFCFRQHFDYETTDKLFGEELDLIRQDNSISEVILSGGDPLSLDDKILEKLLQDIAAIRHVRKIRFHTRFPIGIPERIDASFVKMLSAVPKQIWFNMHINHPRELDTDVWKAFKQIQCLGIPVISSSVLLKDINDNEDVLTELCNLLVDHGVQPYYLHQLDRVQGAAHFEVPEARGLQLIEALKKRLPGYAVPKYVREDAGAPSKTHL